MYHDQSNQPASNYVPRAQAVVQKVIDKVIHPSALVLYGKWQEPMPETMMYLVHNLTGILNWMALEAAKRGVAKRIFTTKWLNEEDMIELEKFVSNIKATIVEDDTAKKKYCTITNEQDGLIFTLCDTGELIETRIGAEK